MQLHSNSCKFLRLQGSDVLLSAIFILVDTRDYYVKDQYYICPRCKLIFPIFKFDYRRALESTKLIGVAPFYDLIKDRLFRYYGG